MVKKGQTQETLFNRYSRNGRALHRTSVPGESSSYHIQPRGWRIASTSTKGSSSNNPCRTAKRMRMLKKEIALMFLILASQTVSELSLRETSLSTELIADDHFFTERPSLYKRFSPSDTSTSNPSSEKHISYTVLSEDMLSSSPSTIEEDGDDEEENQVAEESITVLGGTPRSINRIAFAYDEQVWERILGFLPWRCTLATRGVSRWVFRQTLPYVSVMRLPKTRHPAIFLPCHHDLDATEDVVEHGLSPQCIPWHCMHCGLFNMARNECAKPRCNGTRSSNGCRMFLGQLRRSGTVPLVSWLVDYVFDAPRGALFCVENHRNLNTGRGRGCAWPTISDANTVHRMLASHHRLFFDDVEGVEGVWLVPLTGKAVLQEESYLRGESGPRHKHMPRGTMVVELPAGCGVVLPPPSHSWNDERLPCYDEVPRYDALSGVMHLVGGRRRHDPYHYNPLLMLPPQ